ncbi:MAG: stage II sporulation protein M [Bryobacteraceae bacterium]
MIVDLDRFVAAERRYWDELDSTLARVENNPVKELTIEEAQRYQYLYQRCLADLARVQPLAAAPDVRRYLESLVARAYGEMHESRATRIRFSPWRWFFQTFPITFRRRIPAFWLSCAITLAGCGFGCLALGIDPGAKEVLMPFSHLRGDPKDRVKREEDSKRDRLAGAKGSFSADLMTHNTKVALSTVALGMTFGIGTVTVLFYNGVILGSVSFDYVRADQGRFLAGWLLPHGSIEIPAILLAGQAGLVLAAALIGWGKRASRRQRMREVTPDLVTLVGGAACLLVWAGIVEAFFSQYHEPVLPYGLKIGFGLFELVLLAFFLARAGRTHA